jgi:hypothetical protein
MRTLLHRLVLPVIFLFSFATTSLSQEEFINYYGKNNADATLQLSFIDHEEDYTTLYVSYTGTSNVGEYTGLYLNNLRIIDRDTRREFKPVETGVLPTNAEGKVFFYNSGTAILIRIRFDRLPSGVKNIDIVESDGSSSATYNFTFRNLRINPLLDDSEEFYDFLYDIDSYASTIFSVFDATINVYVGGKFVGVLDRVFKSADYTPSCGEYGTLTVVYANSTERAGSGSATSGGKNYTWNFTVKPKGGFDECHKQRLK